DHDARGHALDGARAARLADAARRGDQLAGRGRPGARRRPPPRVARLPGGVVRAVAPCGGRARARGGSLVIPSSAAFSSIEDALAEIAAGRMIVVVDDADRENEGDLVMAAEFVTAADINFMTRQAGGWICLTLTPERCDELELPLMALRNESAHETPFTV